MEEPAFLMAVQGVVGGVEIEDDLRRRPEMRVEEQLDPPVPLRGPEGRPSRRSIAAASWPIR
jgi:hypothetical protein